MSFAMNAKGQLGRADRGAMENKKTKRWFLCSLIFAVALCASLALAQTDLTVGSIIRNFEKPERDADGNLKFKLHGREATVISQNRIQIRGIQIDLYEKGASVTQVTSDVSDYWMMENKLTTDQGVKITRPGLEITAQSMDWDLKEIQGILKGNVRVVLPNREKILAK